MAGTFIYLRDKDLKLAQDLHIDPKDMVRMLFNAVREHPELRNDMRNWHKKTVHWQKRPLNEPERCRVSYH